MKPKGIFEDDVPPLWDRGRFPAAFWPDPPNGWHVVRICPFVTAPGDKQQQAGWKGDFLRSAAKLSLAAASQLPARSDLWALGWAGAGEGTAGARAHCQFMLFCPQIHQVSCYAGGWMWRWTCVQLFCAHQKWDDCSNVAWVGVWQISLS